MSRKKSWDNLRNQVRICKDWFNGSELKGVCFPLIHPFMVCGAIVELDVAE